jgi:gamma-glutamyltranspeptidase/glutathione hydrolase
MPDEIYVEKGISPDTLKLLRQMGHKIETEDAWSDGECIAIDLKSGERLGASDGRNNGKPVGF